MLAGYWDVFELLLLAVSITSVRLLSHVQLFATPWTGLSVSLGGWLIAVVSAELHIGKGCRNKEVEVHSHQQDKIKQAL